MFKTSPSGGVKDAHFKVYLSHALLHVGNCDTATSMSAAIRPEFQLVLFIYSEKCKEKY